MLKLPKVHKIFDPPRFQGHGKERGYFEGWYFKLVLAEAGVALAFIPGVSYDADGRGHAFLQLLDGVARKPAYLRYPVEEFLAARDRFFVRLGPHTFSTNRIHVSTEEIEVDLRFHDLHPWRPKPWAPGIMGWYGYLPFLECYHGLVSLHHRLEGRIRIGGRAYDASGGVGYTEKDWGTSFPSSWVWLQSNHISGESEPVSLMASVARIPWRGSHFVGFLCTFLFRGELHVFTTWNGSSHQLELDRGLAFRLTFRKGKKVLTLTGRPAPGGSLASPIEGGMTGKISESLTGEVGVTLGDFSGTATWAGVEVHPDAAELVD